MKLWYLAHPIAPDDWYNTEENLVHIPKLIKIFWEAGYNVCAPYHTFCLVIADDMANRQRGLQMDFEFVLRFDGIILTGHRLSSGMAHELEIAKSSSKEVMNFVGVADHAIADLLHQMNDRQEM